LKGYPCTSFECFSLAGPGYKWGGAECRFSSAIPWFFRGSKNSSQKSSGYQSAPTLKSTKKVKARRLVVIINEYASTPIATNFVFVFILSTPNIFSQRDLWLV
jgi:hypothetical protein